MPAASSFSLTPISDALGAEIEGVDLSAPLSAELAAEIRAALLEHLVLLFRGQQLDPDQLLRCARAFGEPTEYPFLRGVGGHPEVVEVLKRADETVNFGGVWHADTTYTERPPMGALLYAVKIPPQGGDTLFANMVRAYETLPRETQREIEGLRALSTSGKAQTAATRTARIEDQTQASKEPSEAEDEEPLSAWHPVVRTHPETGRRSLFVSAAHTLRFEGRSEEESAPLLEQLWAHQTREELTCRLRWSPGALALWDNRCTLHYPVNDYHGYERRMYRVSLAGDRPR